MKGENTGALRWVYDTTAGQRLRMLVLILGTGILSASSVAFALACRGIIDSAVARNTKSLMTYAVCILFLLALQLIFRLLTRNLQEQIRARLEVKVKSRIFATILRKQYRDVTAYHSGELQNRLVSDVTVVCDGISGILPELSAMIARLIAAFVALILLESWFAVLFFVGGALMFGITRAFRGVLKRMHKRVQAADGKVRAYLQESLESLLVVKVFGEEDRVEERAGALQEEHYRAKRSRWRLTSIASTGISFAFQTVYVFALFWCAVELMAGTISFGTLNAILQLVGQIQAPLTNLSGFLPRYYGMLASAERLQELESMEEEPKEGKLEDPRAFYESIQRIEFQNITFSYGREQVLENTGITLIPGDFVAIMGRSGIGKSTLLKLLLDVFPVDAGSITFETENASVPASCATRPLFSYVPQGNMLFSGSIRENLTFAAQSPSEEEIAAALRISCVDRFLPELPEGLDTLIGEHGHGLSEGQVQRVAIARALLKKAPILLLDEATSALDEETEEAVLRQLKELKNVTCIIVSHKRAALRVCNRHIWIEEKKICEKVENA